MSTLSRRSVLAAFGAAAIPPVVAAGARPALAAEPESNTKLYADPQWREGRDYARRFRRHAAHDNDETANSAYPDTAILALHGGAIEGGTSELCLAIAGYHPNGGTYGGSTGGTVYDYWMFEGIRPADNGQLHVTSAHCDDPVARATAGGSWRTISVHGCSPAAAGTEDDDEPAAVLVGGLHAPLKAALITAYRGAGIRAIDANTVPDLAGVDPFNIVNRNLRNAGVQLELTTPLRERMFELNTRLGRKGSVKAPFWTFADTTREVLAR